MVHLMPTLNPRVTITLTPAVAAVLRELSKLAGNSQSAIVGELLQTSLPVFERVVTALKAAQSIQQSATSEIAAGLHRAQSKLEDQLGLMLGDVDESMRPLLEEAEKIARRGGRTAPLGAVLPPRARSTPVLVTRGSGSQPGAKSKSKRVLRGTNRKLVSGAS